MYTFNLPTTFAGYVGDFFKGLFTFLRNVIIPFSTVSLFDIFIGTIALGAIGKAISYFYKGDSTQHE